MHSRVQQEAYIRYTVYAISLLVDHQDSLIHTATSWETWTRGTALMPAAKPLADCTNVHAFAGIASESIIASAPAPPSSARYPSGLSGASGASEFSMTSPPPCCASIGSAAASPTVSPATSKQLLLQQKAACHECQTAPAMIGCNVHSSCKLGQSKEESKDRFGNLALIHQHLLMSIL